MEINKHMEDKILNVALTGRLDTNTAPELQESLADDLAGLSALAIDLAHLEYISSAGLRVLLALHKKCAANGASLTILNCNEMTADVFRMTGFHNILHIQ